MMTKLATGKTPTIRPHRVRQQQTKKQRPQRKQRKKLKRLRRLLLAKSRKVTNLAKKPRVMCSPVMVNTRYRSRFSKGHGQKRNG
ncbi:MAG TPA: hypothetical protein ENJ24_01880 [Gammaproteobacteria bacterium]|nr:hypothetical protein [Gammaproteobacteria bacterium]